MTRERYTTQVRLLVRALPLIAEESAFALKGGTAINLFHRDMPRLSVDADLVYLPKKARQESLAEMRMALERIMQRAERRIPGASIRISQQPEELRLLLQQGTATVKVETSPVIRGTVHPPVIGRIRPSVEEEFGFAEMATVTFEDLYAGKLVAALDRQHPRDLYDVKLLLDNEGISNELFRTFLVYVASSSRPPHELLAPPPN